MISDAKIQQVNDALRELEAWVAKHRAIIHSEPGVGVIVSFIGIGARARPYKCKMVTEREPCEYEILDLSDASKAWVTLNTKISTSEQPKDSNCEDRLHRIEHALAAIARTMQWDACITREQYDALRHFADLTIEEAPE